VAPLSGVWMRMQGDGKRLKVCFHPYFFLLSFHVGLWRVFHWVCILAIAFLHINGNWVKKRITKYAIFSVFMKVVSPCFKFEFLLQKWYFLNLNPSNKIEVIYSSFYSNLNFRKFLILNILLQFELWMYFQWLLNSIYRMTQKFNLHHDVHHYNIHTWLNFCIFWNNFWFDMIFLHFIFENS